MSLEYIAETYKVPAETGVRVRYTGDGPAQTGTIVGARSALIKVLMDGDKKPGIYHPTWEMKYLTVEQACEVEPLLAAPRQQAVPVDLQHMACSEDGVLRWMTGRYTPDCELYAMPDFGRAPTLYTAAPQAEQAVPSGFRVMKPTSLAVRDGDRWEIYAPCGSGGIVHEDDVTDWVVRKLLDALTEAPQAEQTVEPASHCACLFSEKGKLISRECIYHKMRNKWRAAPDVSALVEALERISLGSKNSMTSREILGKEARAALAAHKGEKA